jgi:hypothetical protein
MNRMACSTNIVRIISWRMMRFMRHVARVTDKVNGHKILV